MTAAFLAVSAVGGLTGSFSDTPIFSSVVLANPAVIGGLAAAAVCWGGFVTRPDPGRRRVLQLAGPQLRTQNTDRAVRSGAAVPAARPGPVPWLHRNDIPHPDRVAAELGAMVDVMNVALVSGLSITASLQLALAHLDEASAVRRRLAGLASFERLDETLEEFGHACGPRARAFAAAVTGSMHTGIPLAPEMERLGRELREDRRRQLEGKVRRLPVMLLFPLVLCVLPALGLVAIVPVLVAAFGA